MRFNRIVAVGLAAASLLGLGATAASAFPVRNIITETITARRAAIAAQVWSPPGGGCGANTYFGVYPPNSTTQVWGSFKRINVCRYKASGGWSYGVGVRVVDPNKVPAGRYTICVTAGGTVNGLPSRHTSCVNRRIG